ncbi:hypothetical protein FNYG_07489 [Fusarium nygamai]|uniref:Uncharacterized protein n=1 Tax=Gibberella nygamai TaxID=42673 RepID=A0A2K0W9Z7_GIBNY|nr:hypothetical protein FNYG_07489 [Fusarium nygamai]
MSEQENEGPSGQQVANPSTAKSPQDGSVTVRRPATFGKKYDFSRPSPKFLRGPPPLLPRTENASRAARVKRTMAAEALGKHLKKNAEDIRALEHRYEELRSTVEALGKKYEELYETVEALQSELRGRSNCVDQV